MLQLLTGGGLGAVVDDPAPVLGGDLDGGGHNISNVALGTFGIINATDEDVGYQIDGTTVLWTGAAVNSNIFLGVGAFNNDEGQYNVGIGYQAGYWNDTSGGGNRGKYNIYLGYRAGHGGAGGANEGYWNVAMGYRALYANTTGYENFALGYQSMFRNTTAPRSVAIGAWTLQAGNSGFSIAIGSYALTSADTYYCNSVGIGQSALKSQTTGKANIGIGKSAGLNNKTGAYNTTIGSEADGCGAGAVYSHSNMTSIGYRAGYNNETGGDGVYIGHKAGYNQTINNNLLIIDNRDRLSAANEATKALIYGIFAAAPADQDLAFNANVFLTQVKSGATQVAAGAAVNEVWKTNGHASLPDDVLMIGV